jgi:hypothetical protein
MTATDSIEACNVLWETPGRDSSGSMPLGNGDLGINLWVEEDGDLRFYLSKTDACDEQGRLLKLGGVRLNLSPNPFAKGRFFRQELRLARGEIEIRAGDRNSPVVVRVWVDANHPVVRLEGSGTEPFTVRASFECWRRERRTLSEAEASGVDRFAREQPPVVHPDTILQGRQGGVTWYHRNATSIWSATLEHQGLGSLIPQQTDPLLGRTFGGVMFSKELAAGQPVRNAEAACLESAQPVRQFRLGVLAQTAQTASAEDWLAKLEQRVAKEAATDWGRARTEHRSWWASFWDRSWVRLIPAPGATSGNKEAETINRGYALQRFISAAGGRGAFPIKFNGSIFTVDVPGKFDADYRQWGGCYWFQNTRLAYWPMLAAGDFDLMQPLFTMYRQMLPLAKARTRIYFGHEGAFFPETMHFWGAYHNGEMGYGWDRRTEPFGRVANRYIRYHWSSGLELLAMILDYHVFFNSKELLHSTLFPIADAVLEFYTRHYPLEPNGRLLLTPAQALETWWECENPMPEVAGLHFVLDRLLSLPASVVGDTRLAVWRALRAKLPPVPRREVDGQVLLRPAENFRIHQNMENPELYAIFPFRLFGVGKPELELARRTFERRQYRGNRGWQQDDTQMAMLGLADQAGKYVVDRFASKHEGSRFPAFWGPNFDWVPDQDHGGNGMMALQTMLLQTEGRSILLFPAWPRGWDVEFKLHAPLETTVEGLYRSGRLERLEVTPRQRAADVKNCLAGS